MAPISHRAEDWEAAASQARRQEGLITRGQLEASGLSTEKVKLGIRDRRLLPVFRGVFVLGHAPIEARTRMRAAAMACPGAVISHRSAAVLLGFGKTAPSVVDLIPTVQRGRGIPGIKAHRVPYPGDGEWGYVGGIPVTGVARTIVDLAGVYGEPELHGSIERAATRRILDVPRIDAILASGPKRRGAPCLRRVLDHWRPVAERVKFETFRSLFEAKLLPLLVAEALPLPHFNVPVGTAERVLEVDLLWERERLVVEADSRRHHGIEVAFERDHKRTRELIAAGYGVLRVTWREAEEEAEAVFAVIRQELARRSGPAPVPQRSSTGAARRGPTLPT